MNKRTIVFYLLFILSSIIPITSLQAQEELKTLLDKAVDVKIEKANSQKKAEKQQIVKNLKDSIALVKKDTAVKQDDQFVLEEAVLFDTSGFKRRNQSVKSRSPEVVATSEDGWQKALQFTHTNVYKKEHSLDSTKKVFGWHPYIVNAGLVLIHPFLQRFFSLCGLLEKRKFKDEESAQKAVHLLHYIVTKIDTPEEHQLVLDKILCGIPLSEPIDRTIELTDDERETCESLIRGVVENWPILKKTSNENFRVSLLQREGRLTREEGLWRLKVEEKSYDVLLDKLPWSISMIKLPWMEKMIQVEWR